MIIRITSQCCGLAFGTLGWQHWQLLIAYLIPSAEGYFSLVLCAYRFLIAWQEHVLGQSFLEPKNVRALALQQRFSLRNATQMVLVHYALIGANTIIIVGGSLMSDFQTTVNWRTDPTVFTGKVLRTVGQAIFVLLIQHFFISLIITARRATYRSITLYLIAGTYPFLTVRGVYGVLSAADNSYNYYNPTLYTDTRVSSKFVLVEYSMTTTMEYLSCAILLSTYLTADGKPDFEHRNRDREATELNSNHK